eukprot:1159207-Pelagomonas_calceolata.AAC.3
MGFVRAACWMMGCQLYFRCHKSCNQPGPLHYNGVRVLHNFLLALLGISAAVEYAIILGCVLEIEQKWAMRLKRSINHFDLHPYR